MWNIFLSFSGLSDWKLFPRFLREISLFLAILAENYFSDFYVKYVSLFFWLEKNQTENYFLDFYVKYLYLFFWLFRQESISQIFMWNIFISFSDYSDWKLFLRFLCEISFSLILAILFGKYFSDFYVIYLSLFF